MNSDKKRRLHFAAQRIEKMLGPVDGYRNGYAINQPKTGDLNFAFKNSLISISDSVRESALIAIASGEDVAGTIVFDDSIYHEIEERLSSDSERQDYIELARAIHEATLLLSPNDSDFSDKPVGCSPIVSVPNDK